MSQQPSFSSSACAFPETRDAVTEIQLFLSNLFMALMPSPPARAKMHLAAISQPPLCTMPTWFFWRDDLPGAFLLRLDEAAILPPGKDGTAQGRFHINYYPALENDPAFDGLSVHEQVLRLSKAFDATGTPSMDSDDLPESAFCVGYLELCLHRTRELAEIHLTAQNLWAVRRTAPLDVPDAAGNPVRLLEAGDLDRAMPGWELAWKLFDTLVTAIGLFYAGIPLAVLLWERTGMLLESSGEHLSPCPQLDLKEHHQLVFLPWLQDFSQRQRDVPTGFDLLQNELDLCDQEHGTVTQMLVQPPDSLSPEWNPFWWQPTVDADLTEAGLCCLVGHDTPLPSPVPSPR